VRLEGESEIWQARCPAGAERGAVVTVVGVDGLTLVVDPAPPSPPGEGSPPQAGSADR